MIAIDAVDVVIALSRALGWTEAIVGGRMDCFVSVHPVGSCVVVDLVGEVDLANGDYVERQLCSVFASRPAGVVIDLSGTEFCGSRGVRALLRAEECAREAQAILSLAAPGETLHKMLRIAEVDTVVPVHVSVEDALFHQQLLPSVI